MSVLDVEETIQTPVVVYPNPTDGMVYVEVESGEKQVVSIIDPLGRKVYEQIWIPFGERLPLDLSSFPSGHYTVVVTSDSGQTAERIVREWFYKEFSWNDFSFLWLHSFCLQCWLHTSRQAYQNLMWISLHTENYIYD